MRAHLCSEFVTNFLDPQKPERPSVKFVPLAAETDKETFVNRVLRIARSGPRSPPFSDPPPTVVRFRSASLQEALGVSTFAPSGITRGSPRPPAIGPGGWGALQVSAQTTGPVPSGRNVLPASHISRPPQTIVRLWIQNAGERRSSTTSGGRTAPAARPAAPFR